MEYIFVVFLFALVGLVVGLIYFAPSLVAHHMQHPYGGVLFLLNLVLGWTTVVWVILLIWAIVGAPKVIIVERPARGPAEDNLPA